ncbi:MAG TPA: hypothetical protein VGF98_10980 [Candidatus Tumulicola sp.]|jgi:hypothetical protein
MSAAITEDANEAIAVIVVHGVMPHPRYEIQDFAASNLLKELQVDPYWGQGRTWKSSVYNRPDPKVEKSYMPKPTISRVQTVGIDAEPTPYFDVIESYWSPLDKGKTSFISVAAWLLRSVFVPLNTSAHYAARFWKTVYDFGLIFSGIIAVVAFLLGALLATVATMTRLVALAGRCETGSSASTWIVRLRQGSLPYSWNVLLHKNSLPLFWNALLHQGPVPSSWDLLLSPATRSNVQHAAPCAVASAWSVLLNPTTLESIFSPWTLGIIAAGVVGAFLVAQVCKAVVTVVSQDKQLRRYGEQRYERWAFIVLALAGGLALLFVTAVLPIKPGEPAGGLVPVYFVLAAMLFVGGRTIAKSWIVNFFGDVQIYTTRNENLDFFAMREAILERVTKTIVSACKHAGPDGTSYDRVYVLAHSLGSTIAMDALIRFFDLCEQAPDLSQAMRRLRGFVTFGSPLEKTKFFFDVNDPSPSLALDQWNSDLYGTLFTPDARELTRSNEDAQGIFWLNDWYFLDAVSNKINSYRSFTRAGAGLAQGPAARTDALNAARGGPKNSAVVAPVVAMNQIGSKGFVFPEIIPHSEYLSDPWFWESSGTHLGVLDVLTGQYAATQNRLDAIPPPQYRTFKSARYSVVEAKEAARYPEHYKIY